MDSRDDTATDISVERVRSAVAGDADALSALLRICGPLVERTLQVGDPYRSLIDPADIMQVTYMEAFLRIGSFDALRPHSFEAWLRQIAHNNLRDAIRGIERQKQPPPRNRLQPSDSDESLIGLYDQFARGSSATPSRSVGRRELRDYVIRMIDELPERYGRVVRMCDIEGRSAVEVAAAMGKSPGAIHMLRARAHDRLRERIGTSSPYFSDRS
ncbi:MAG: sigma-70 family RNA polymerase sigma factor [Phycisphaerae bacterium]|nr:sigma-70 family RNA polymerase sigma factor [Phycisphaerae bacterium]